ncbi:MAG: hypothetical protein JXB36_08250 [Gammaproteobacteria bacterium]|nr:hypothetical protein [Gammaproteobacteria bacterium]
MVYLKWTASDLVTLELRELYTEVDDDGWVQRELGVDFDGYVTHQLVPTSARPGWFGIARLSNAMLGDQVSKAEFDSLWEAACQTDD